MLDIYDYIFIFRYHYRQKTAGVKTFFDFSPRRDEPLHRFGSNLVGRRDRSHVLPNLLQLAHILGFSVGKPPKSIIL